MVVKYIYFSIMLQITQHSSCSAMPLIIGTHLILVDILYIGDLCKKLCKSYLCQDKPFIPQSSTLARGTDLVDNLFAYYIYMVFFWMS